jgi:outer membrane protein assembly factor BamB
MQNLPPLVVCFLSLLAASCFGGEWPQWRGPRREGVVEDSAWKLTALKAEPKVLWEIAAGPGQASPVVSGKRVVFLDGVDEKETAHCLDLDSGKELWRAVVGPTVEFQNAYGEGPRCTPLIDGDRVYVQSCGGEFACLSLESGKKLWGFSFGEKYGATWFGNKSPDPGAKETASRRHGNNGSAVIDGKSIYIPVGSPTKGTLIAFDKLTGAELWAAGNDNTAYSSVMVADLAGVRQVVHFTADALMGVEAGTGKILWREPLKTGAKRHVATPLIEGDTVTVTSTSIGLIRFRVKKDGDQWSVKRDWENQNMKVVIGTPTRVGKWMFSPGPGAKCDLVCVDAATGEEKWKEPGLGDYASITAVNDSLLVLSATGELRLVKASGERYEELGRSHFVGKTWASPAYVDGKLLVKDGSKLVAVALTP